MCVRQTVRQRTGARDLETEVKSGVCLSTQAVFPSVFPHFTEEQGRDLALFELHAFSQ